MHKFEIGQRVLILDYNLVGTITDIKYSYQEVDLTSLGSNTRTVETHRADFKYTVKVYHEKTKQPYMTFDCPESALELQPELPFVEGKAYDNSAFTDWLEKKK